MTDHIKECEQDATFWRATLQHTKTKKRACLMFGLPAHFYLVMDDGQKHEGRDIFEHTQDYIRKGLLRIIDTNMPQLRKCVK